MKNLRSAVICLAALAAVSCGGKKESNIVLLPESGFSAVIDGRPVALYTIGNGSGITAQITNYGARLVSLWVPDRDGRFVDVVQGQSTVQGYLDADEKFYGATVGRYANRIADGRFTLDGNEYQLDINDGKNHLHGGSKGFFAVVWDFVSATDSTLTLRYRSADGEEGYPGNLDTELTYSLDADNNLTVSYKATTDMPTVVNLSHHSYFNLSGAGQPTINDHALRLYASNFTPTDSTLIPTGEIRSVEGTPMDFREFTAIGDRVGDDYEPLKIAGGYDHNWVLDGAPGSKTAAEVYSPLTGILMTVLTDEPAIQFYGGNFIKGVDRAKDGVSVHGFRSALCLETQGFPDSPNHGNFPSTVLRPGEVYSRFCTYRFGIME